MQDIKGNHLKLKMDSTEGILCRGLGILLLLATFISQPSTPERPGKGGWQKQMRSKPIRYTAGCQPAQPLSFLNKLES
jgi:hypothetical protein